MHFLNACILKTDEKNALHFKNANFKNQMSTATEPHSDTFSKSAISVLKIQNFPTNLHSNSKSKGKRTLIHSRVARYSP